MPTILSVARLIGRLAAARRESNDLLADRVASGKETLRKKIVHDDHGLRIPSCLWT